MASRSATPPEDDAAGRGGSGAYADYLAEREEVLRHKWLLSEKAGRDVGFEAALVDWVEHHRHQWRKSRVRT